MLKYELVKANKKDINRLIEYKRKTIFEYANNLDKDEIKKINTYIDNSVSKEINNYYKIVIKGKTVGCLLTENKDDGILIDELYLESEYRNKKIGSNIIENIIDNNKIVYLWVYKLNEKAIKLYKRLGFTIIEETDTRLHMKKSC